MFCSFPFHPFCFKAHFLSAISWASAWHDGFHLSRSFSVSAALLRWVPYLLLQYSTAFWNWTLANLFSLPVGLSSLCFCLPPDWMCKSLADLDLDWDCGLLVFPPGKSASTMVQSLPCLPLVSPAVLLSLCPSASLPCAKLFQRTFIILSFHHTHLCCPHLSHWAWKCK